jgi:hypothetical protein
MSQRGNLKSYRSSTLPRVLEPLPGAGPLCLWLSNHNPEAGTVAV